MFPQGQVAVTDGSETSSIDSKDKEKVAFEPPKRFYWAFISLSLLALGASFSLTSLSIAVVVCLLSFSLLGHQVDFYLDDSQRIQPHRAKGILARIVIGTDFNSDSTLLRLSLQHLWQKRGSGFQRRLPRSRVSVGCRRPELCNTHHRTVYPGHWRRRRIGHHRHHHHRYRPPALPRTMVRLHRRPLGDWHHRRPHCVGSPD
jgi:hypothetical protein